MFRNKRNAPSWILESPRNISILDGAALLALAITIRLAGLGAKGLWNDELFTVFWSGLPPDFLLGDGARIETNPPYYYLFMHYWIGVFGGSEFSVRFPPLLFSASTVVVIYALGVTLIDQFTARIAALLACFNPVSIYFAQEARAYALVALLDGLMILALAKHEIGKRAGGHRSRAWPLIFVAASVATFCAHYTSLIFIVSCFAAIAAKLAATHPLDIRETMTWMAAGFVVALVILAPASTARHLSNSVSISWINPLSWNSVQIFMTDSVLAQGMYKTAFGEAGAVIVLLICALAAPRLDRSQFGLLILIPGVFCATLVAVSLWRPILLPRVGSGLVVPLCLLLARAAATRATFWRGVATAIAALVIFISALGVYFSSRKEDWRGAAEMVAGDPKCDGPIIYGRDSGLGLVYYQPLLKSRPFQAVPEYPQDADTASFALAQKVLHSGVLDVEAVPAFVWSHPHAALVLRSPSLSTRTPFPPALERAHFDGELIVACF
jgi:hypothetical protein